MFDAIYGLVIGRAVGMIEEHKRRTVMATIEAHKRAQKPRIAKANTPRATVIWPVGPFRYGLIMGAPDYIEELRTQAKWDAEKCANQQ